MLQTLPMAEELVETAQGREVQADRGARHLIFHQREEIIAKRIGITPEPMIELRRMFAEFIQRMPVIANRQRRSIALDLEKGEKVSFELFVGGFGRWSGRVVQDWVFEDSSFRPIFHHLMLTKRIIPCLDVTDGRVVKGTKFLNLRDAGDPVECAMVYNDQGADELVFLDITASSDGRDTMVDVVRRTVEHCFMPVTVGGGIRTVDDMRQMLLAGADKVGVNTAAVKNPEVISQGAKAFGCQCIVVAIDAKRNDAGSWTVYTHGGRTPTERDAIEWAREAEERGAGEILLTSMDADGTKAGYDIELNATVSEAVNIPVIASGGAGNLEHMADVLLDGKADAVLAASIFHFGESPK